jgi:hypothetical protein
MNKPIDDFVSREKRKYKWVIGKVAASSLSGFIAGAIVMAIIFLTVFNLSLK